MDQYNVAAIIPVHGRLPLLKYTIKRLVDVNKIKHVVCIGETEHERLICEDAGAEFILHENTPLGKKWNFGFKHVSKFSDPVDAVVFVGSSDFLSANWMEETRPLLGAYKMIGVRGFHMADISVSHDLRIKYWPGYTGGKRKDEPIGIGRVLSKQLLDDIDWKPFDDAMNGSMDYQMYCNVQRVNGAMCMLDDPRKMMALSISCDLWPNKHNFDELGSVRGDYTMICEEFSELIKFKNEMYGRM